MADSLYEDINNAVIKRAGHQLLTGGKINMPDWVSDFAEALADMILQQEKVEQPKLVAHAHKQLDHFMREKKHQ